MTKNYCGHGTVMGHGDNAICGEPYIDGIYQCPSCKLKDFKFMTDLARFSPEYKALQEYFHTQRDDYGRSGQRYALQIHELSRKLNTQSILDYGCGKCTLAHNLPFPIRSYDPFIPEYSQDPSPADIVVCTDVMEHVEEEYVSPVLLHIKELTLRMVFFEISTTLAKKILPDGRNAHITVRSAEWWIRNLMDHFEPLSFHNSGNGILFIGAKK